MTFNELNIVEPILRAVREKGYTEPTPIQEQAIPAATQGRDILGIAQTGTGKTAAFAIPIIQQLMSGGATKGPREIKALILTPTRELAIQIDDCFNDYGRHTSLRHCVIFGGVKQGAQTRELERGMDILVATPGRLLDLITQGYIRLSAVRHFVLDEADRMLDLGFIRDVKRILPMLPTKRQTLFFSATMPDAVHKLSREILTNPLGINIAPDAPAVETVDQCLYHIEKAQKKDLLINLLHKEVADSVLVFSRTKYGADKIAKLLCKAGIGSEAIHGDKTQGARQRALANFKSGKTRVMVATDIAARGLDIQELSMVINYDLPAEAETYVHRIGRTGRAGHSGRALSFCSTEEQPLLKDIQKLTGLTIRTVRA